MILQYFSYSSDLFQSFFPILSVAELNFAGRAGAKLHFKILKCLEKILIAEFGTPFA